MKGKYYNLYLSYQGLIFSTNYSILGFSLFFGF
jgi:hypothetical protein